ncbi:hypothetical protein, partial [Microbispora tritici]
MPHPDRLGSRRRLCLNLGPGTRWLVVGDRTIMSICRVLGRDQAGHLPPTDDVRAYVADGHPLRCLRIRLGPGEERGVHRDDHDGRDDQRVVVEEIDDSADGYVVTDGGRPRRPGDLLVVVVVS